MNRRSLLLGAAATRRVQHDAGFDFPAILSSLTTTPARRFGFASRKGRIARGMDGDLVVLNGDPSADIGALSRVRQTKRGGVVTFGARVST